MVSEVWLESFQKCSIGRRGPPVNLIDMSKGVCPVGARFRHILTHESFGLKGAMETQGEVMLPLRKLFIGRESCLSPPILGLWRFYLASAGSRHSRMTGPSI